MRAHPALPGHWDGLVVIRAGTIFQGHRLADQHVAERMVDRGVPVLYVDPPLTLAGARRDPRLREARHGARLRLQRPGLARLTPSAPPGKTRPGIAHLTGALLRIQLRRAARSLTGDVRAVLSVSGPKVFGACAERTSVFWARDDFAAGSKLMRLPAARTARDEERGARASDLVIAVSPALKERWAAQGLRTALVPNGCDTPGLAGVPTAPEAPDVRLERPIAGVVGTIGERIDLDLLDAVAERGHSLLLVGQRQRGFDPARMAKLLERPNVQWVGHRSHADLPGYLRAIDVGLVPYAPSPFNRASFPLKTLEYLAAGRRVVSTDLPATRWLDTPLVPVGGTPSEFLELVDEALSSPASAEEITYRQAFASRHDWSRRVDDILALLP